jgi:hypothetical protein
VPASPANRRTGRYGGRVNDEADDDVAARDEIEFLRQAAVEDILGNHIFHLIQLAAIHLAATPPQLDQARLCIDVVSAMINAGGERLGEHVGLYRNALAEVQQVFIRASTATTSTDGSD